MTLSTPHDEDLNPANAFAVMQRHLKEFALEIEKRRSELKNEQNVDTSEAQKLLTSLRTTSENYLKEAGRLEDLHRKQAGIVHEFAFDLEAARNEIRGRLASLRSAARSD